MSKYIVQVVEYKTGHAVHTIGPFYSERQAEKADDGLQRNLNHELYFTQLVEQPQ